MVRSPSLLSYTPRVSGCIARQAIACLATLLCLVLSASTAHAGGLFPSTHMPIDLSFYRTWAATCDLNGDGEADLVQVCSTPSGWVLLTAFGDGTGAFPDTATYAITGYLQTPGAVGDVDGDGRPDFVFSCPNTPTRQLGVWRSNADGTLQPPVYSTLGPTVFDLALGDVNGDGNLDVVTTSADYPVLDLCASLGNGNGTFAAPIHTPINMYGYGLALGDIDGDGTLDALALDGSVRVLRGLGNGSFGANLALLAASDARCAAVADLNGDGHLDILAGGTSATVLLSQPGGSFTRTDYYMNGTRVLRGLIVDLDGDGQLDLACLNDSHQAGIRYGTGGGAFGGLQLAAGPAISMGAVDFNHDGRLDLICDRGSISQISPRVFGERNAYPCGPAAIGSAVADLNGDAIPDVVVANRYASTVSVLLGKPGLQLGAAATIAMGSMPFGVTLADLNGDALPDLITPGHGTSVVSIRLGAGGGAFGPESDLLVPLPPSSVAVGDLDGDGTPDLAVASDWAHAGGRIVTLHGHGDGTFDAPVASPNNYQWLLHIALGDLNEDGRLDAMVSGNTSLGVFLGNGDGTFGVTTYLGAANEAVFADVNGDGHLDIAFGAGNASSSAYNSGILLGHGDGTFDAAVGYAMNGDCVAVAVADLDGDGHPDLVASRGSTSLQPNASIDELAIRLGLGDGTFGPLALYGTEFGPNDIKAADFDGDGRPELVITHFAAWNISVLRNRSALLAAPSGRPAPGALSLTVAPNPAPRGALVRFALSIPRHTRLIMRDITGRTVAVPLDRDLPAGSHEVRWDGRTSSGQRAAPGVYFADIVTHARRSAQRLVVIQ